VAATLAGRLMTPRQIATNQAVLQCDVCGPPGTMWVPWITTTVTGTSYTFDWVGAQSGRWRITAISNSGAMGVPSGFRTFRYTV